MKLYIIHPGIQHAPYLANATLRSRLFENVTLLTSILFKPNTITIGSLKKRVKPIDADVIIINHYFYTLLFEVTKFIHNKIVVNNQNQSHNNPIYFWQQVFGYLCLPRIWLDRKNCMVVCFETAGWPVTKYCKKWGIPVIMDFASISHEKAKELGINETKSGISVKTKERKHIDYAFFCSEFCKESFEGKTSSKKNITLYLGAEQKDPFNYVFNTPSIVVEESFIKISFIANLEYRKGLDHLLEALLVYNQLKELKVYFIGRINKDWVTEYLNGRKLPSQVSLNYQTALPQQQLFNFLAEQRFDLNIQPSRFDSFAMVVPETMMLGIPNILSPFVGAGEMIDHLENGYRMESLNATSILDALNWYLGLNVKEVTILRLNVLLKAKQMTWDNYYHQTAKVFKQILMPKKEIKLAFLVEFPTQFEVPFYQFINKWIKEQKENNERSKNNHLNEENWEFHVIYNKAHDITNTDKELKQQISWGFDLYEGYTYHLAEKNNTLAFIKKILIDQGFDFIIINGYKNSYKGLPELCKAISIPIGLRIDSVKYNLSLLKKPLKYVYLPYAYRHFNHFFAVGTETKEFLNWIGVPSNKINYFSYTTHDVWFNSQSKDSDKISTLKLKLGIKNEKVIISVAKFIDRESPWDILQAFDLLNDENSVLILVGDGKDRNSLEKFAFDKPHLKIIFTGYIQYLELPYYYGIADIFVHAAKNEPWGVSVQEALASGCTVITSDKVGSSRDLIKHGVNGFIYQYNEIKQLSILIQKAFQINQEEKKILNAQLLNQWSYQAMWQQIKEGALNCIKLNFK